MGEREFARLLVAVRVLADRSSGQRGLGHLAEMGGVGHGGGECLRADQNEEVAFFVDVAQPPDGLDDMTQAFEIVTAAVLAHVDDQLLGTFRSHHRQQPLRVESEILIREPFSPSAFRLGEKVTGG